MGLVRQGIWGGARYEIHTESANGQTAVTVKTKFNHVDAAWPVYLEGATNPTYGVYVSDITGGNVQFKSTAVVETATVAIMVVGI